MAAIAWVLVDDTSGAQAGDGSTLSAAALYHVAEACSAQLNGEYAREHGGAATIRVASSPTDILPGERVYAFVASLPNAPGASAYHDVNGAGVPVAYCAVTTCADLYGPQGISVDASHEILETAGDEGCNQYADDGQGTLHAREMCDAVEASTYPYTCADGTVVHISNWLLRAWYVPTASGPYDYMTSAGLDVVPPPGPLQTAPANGGNYQLECPSTSGQETSVFAAVRRGLRLEGTPRKPEKTAHWSSRAARRGLR